MQDDGSFFSVSEVFCSHPLVRSTLLVIVKTINFWQRKEKGLKKKQERISILFLSAHLDSIPLPVTVGKQEHHCFRESPFTNHHHLLLLVVGWTQFIIYSKSIWGS